MRHAVLLAFAACHDPPPDIGEMVVYQLAEIGDVVVSGNTIRWTDGMAVHEASLDSMPIGNRESVALGETRVPLVIDGDTVYLVDTEGVVAATGGSTTRVVDEYNITEILVDTQGSLYWGHSASLSWFGPDGVVRSAHMDADGVVDLGKSGDRLFAATVGYYPGPLGLTYESRLYEVDATGGATELVTGGDFVEDFIDDGHFGALDQYTSDGLYAIDDHVYWSVALRSQDSQYDQTLVVQATTSSLPIVLEARPRGTSYWVHEGAFYWMADGGLWRRRPGSEPEHVFDGFIRAVAIADGYLYGFVKSISIDGYDLRRVVLP